MMGDVGEDIKEAYEAAGSSFTILRGDDEIGGGYFKDKLNRLVTKPFIREFFLEVSLAYDTVVLPGEVVRMDTTTEVYLVMNLTPQVLENEIIAYHCVFYKCNVSGELKRPTETDGGWGDDYRINAGFSTFTSGCYALQTEALYGHDLETDEELGMLGLENHELYVPHSVGVQIHDRYEPVSGEYYRAETIKTRRYNGIDVVGLAQDTR